MENTLDVRELALLAMVLASALSHAGAENG